jgi:hypothetical protein
MKLRVHYRVHKSKPLDAIRIHVNTVLTLSPYLFNIHFNNILPSTPGSCKRTFLHFWSLSCVLHDPPISYLIGIVTVIFHEYVLQIVKLFIKPFCPDFCCWFV